MDIQTAIKKAIEGGWISPFTWMENLIFVRHRGMGKNTEQQVFLRYILLDPDFWKCLGKAMGWEERTMLQVFPNPTLDTITVSGGERWKYEQHRCLDGLQDGKSAEDYFKQF